MRSFLFNLFLPRFSKLDFTNLLTYIIWWIIFTPLEFLQIFKISLFFLVLPIIFLIEIWKVVFKNEKVSSTGLYLYSSLAIGFSVFMQWKNGLFSFSTNTIFETLLALYSAWILIQTFGMLLIIRMSKGSSNIEKELKNRIDERPFKLKTIFFGSFLTTLLFWLLNWAPFISHPSIGITLVFSIDKIAEKLEPSNSKESH